MWNLIKNDPILKAISVFILGMFAFSFAFSIMFGSGQSGMEHGATTGGYNAASSLGSLIILLSKLLIIILLIGIIIAAVKLIKNHIVGNEPIKAFENLKSKPLSAILLAVSGVIILIFMVSIILPGNSNNSMMSGAINYGYNNYGFGITAILASIVRLITGLSFIGLITGLIMYFKSQYFTNSKAATAVSKETCSNCGVELKAVWKCCPSCGTEKGKNDEAQMIKNELNMTLNDNEEQ